MGQYHRLMNLDKKELVDPYYLGLGSKQYEHTGCEASLSDAMYLLTMLSPERGGGDWPKTPASGRWAGDRVVIVGDYTENADLPSYDDACLLYGSPTFVDISHIVATSLGYVWNVKFETSPEGFVRKEKLSDDEREELKELFG